jgi:phosphoserine aminotransferase
MFEQIGLPSHLKTSDSRFGAGPSLVPEIFLKELLETGKKLLGTSHRKPVVKNLVKEVQVGLKKYFQLDDQHEVVLGNGGATALFDMIGLGMVEKKSHHFVTGEFSSKWYEAHKAIPWISTALSKVDFGFGVTPFIDGDSDMVCCTLNETSTGVIVDQLPTSEDRKKYPHVLVAVDATSAAGQVPCDVNQTDLFFFSPQKVFASEGGLWVAILSHKAIARTVQVKKMSQRYCPIFMSWELAIENAKGNQTYNTPALTTLFFLNQQIKLMNAVGIEKVIANGFEKLSWIEKWVAEKDYLKLFVSEKKYRSNVVVTIDIDDRVPVDELTKKLAQDGIAQDIDGYRKLGRNQLRIALFYNIALEDLKKLTQCISFLIESQMSK